MRGFAHLEHAVQLRGDTPRLSRTVIVAAAGQKALSAEQHGIAAAQFQPMHSTPLLSLPVIESSGELRHQPPFESLVLTLALTHRQVKATLDNVAGVRIPKFEKVGEGHDTNMALTGLGYGGKAIQVSFQRVQSIHSGGKTTC